MENYSPSDDGMIELDIPGGNGILKLFTRAPDLFTVILRVHGDVCASKGSPSVTIRSGKEKNFFLFVQNPNRKIEDCVCLVESKLVNMFLAKNNVDLVYMKDVVFDILNDPYYYVNICVPTEREIEEELENFFGCDLFKSSDIHNIPHAEMVILANEFKIRVKEAPDVDPKLIKVSLLDEYMQIPRSDETLGDRESHT